MRKQLLFILCILLILALMHPTSASAELIAGVQVGYGNTSYSKVLGSEIPSNTEWLSNVWTNYNYNDLLFSALYQGSLGLKGSKDSRNLVQVGAAYRLLEEDVMRVYGGLGYQFINNRFENAKVEGGKRSTLNGSGFVGQVAVDFPISEQFQAKATFTGNPWLKWTFNQDGVTTSNIKAGSSFVFHLDLIYDFSESLGVHLGVLGGTYGVPAFSGKGATNASYKSINLGVTSRF